MLRGRTHRHDNVELEEGVFCGPSMVFANVYNPRALIERKSKCRETMVKRGAALGANCTAVCGTTVGVHTFVAVGAVVNRNVPDYALMVGVPARQIGWMRAYGAQIPRHFQGEGRYTCPYTGQVYELQDKALRQVHP
jgi:UDP-2-acetamido-3-amino-2,3-dideoxy-glucuronate N-acetyltransferase